MTYEEISLILKALKPYESCCAIEEIMAEAKIKLSRGDDEALARLTDGMQNECNTKIETMQDTLLKAKLIMERDEALADEAYSLRDED